MKYTFLKEILKIHKTEDNQELRNCKLFTVFDNNIKIGHFVYHSKQSYWENENSKFTIEFKKKGYLRSLLKISNQAGRSEIGSYEMNNWKSIGMVSLNGHKYQLAILSPEVEHSFFNKSTWGYYKISLSNEFEEALYYFKIDFPVISFLDPSLKPFTGNIELSGNNLDLLFSGFYLVERYLESKDVSS